MKCQSYFPLYNSHYDLNADANGGASPMYNGNATFRSGHYNEYVVPSLLPRGQPFAYKELLRQTMLLHEDTFKDQVQELHRLYRRQKELMDEIRSKEMPMNHLHIEDQSSNSSSARYGQDVLHNLPFFNSRDNIQTSLSSVKEPNGGTLHDLGFAESKGKKIRGKLLDLELPAEVYIDSDDEDFLHATPPTILSPNKRAKVVIESDVKLSAPNRSLTSALSSVLQGEIISPCSSSRIKTNLADLNEPLTMSCLEESGSDKIKNSRLERFEINHDMPNCENSTTDGEADKMTVGCLAQFDMAKSEVYLVSSGRKPAFNLGKNLLLVQALPSLNGQLSSIRGAKILGRQKGVLNKVNASQLCSPNSRVTRSSKGSSSGSKSFVESNCFVSGQNLDLNDIDLNSVAISSPDYTPPSSNIFIEGEDVRKNKRFRMIDINLPCDLTTDDEPHDLDNQLEIDLEAPISPEVEERPPPRGGSEENHPDKSCDTLLELSKLAAEAIVSISLSQSRFHPKSTVLQKSEAYNISNLEWFASLVSSLPIIDDYEAMTLDLTEMKADEYWCKNTIQISTESCLNLLPCETRKGRTRRSKRKDFQREVLPSLASLSRYEVSEDFQLIEGLMEAAGTPWQLSKRRACRMGRKPRVVEQQSLTDEMPDLVGVMKWGKVSRRSRRRRSPASPTVLLKWVEFVI